MRKPQVQSQPHILICRLSIRETQKPFRERFLELTIQHLLQDLIFRREFPDTKTRDQCLTKLFSRTPKDVGMGHYREKCVLWICILAVAVCHWGLVKLASLLVGTSDPCSP